MNNQTTFQIDITVQSFQYVAKKLARPDGASANAQYGQILTEAEKHAAALRLAQRDELDQADQNLRSRRISKSEFERERDAITQLVTRAQEAITRIAAQYAPSHYALQQLAA